MDFLKRVGAVKEERIEILNELHVAEAARKAMILAEKAGFTPAGQHMVSTAVSELARNIFRYAVKGEVAIRILHKEDKKGIEVVAEDEGPGIEHISSAMEDNYSTSGHSLGVGLPGVKRLMDEFTINTERAVGTRIIIRKWVRGRR